ncbi:hypothetical protein ACHAWC_007229 [Mediolabrus comicus]
MGIITGTLSAVISGVTFCFCSASASLCSAWCGNDKPSTSPPSAKSGRMRSVLLLAFSIIVALIFQYALAPNVSQIVWPYFVNAWTGSCANENPELVKVCSGNAGVFRASFAAFLFFVIFGLAAICKPTANRDAWPAKYALYCLFSAGFCFIPNDPLFTPIYLWVARIGSICFILLQQIILVDIAYNWNESWLEKADKAEIDQGTGKGKQWLGAILFSCFILFSLSLAGIIILFVYFGGCPTNDAFISITLVGSIICTVVQLTISETGSLLTSAAMTAYNIYLCGAAVTKNPNAVCNPKLGETSVGNIVFGLLFVVISLMWTGYSYTNDVRLGGSPSTRGPTTTNEATVEDAEEGKPVGGVVVNNKDEAEESIADATTSPASFNNSWKLNAVLSLICCWYAMTLTGWGSVDKRGDMANPDVGQVSMWMLIVSQWIAMLLYLWTLVAPKIFPNRDFS